MMRLSNMGSQVRKNLVVILFLFFVALVCLLTFLRSEHFLGDGSKTVIEERSIYSSNKEGYRAWYLSCQKAGISLHVWKKRIAELPEHDALATMLVVKPYSVVRKETSFTPAEARQVMQWVAKGNTLVLLDDFKRAGSKSIAQLFHLSTSSSAVVEQGSHVHVPALLYSENLEDRLSAFVSKPVRSRQRFFFSGVAGEHQVDTLLTNEAGQPVMISVPYRRGRFVLGTVTDLAENQMLGLSNQDNFQFLSNLLLADGKPILINEFVHGYQYQKNALNYYLNIPAVSLLLMQIGIGILFLLWLGFFRWRPSLGKTSDVVVQETDFVEASTENLIHNIASLYCQNRATALAVKPYFDRLSRLAERKYRLSMSQPAHKDRLVDMVVQKAKYLNCKEGDSLEEEYFQACLQDGRQLRALMDRSQDLLGNDQSVQDVELVKMVYVLRETAERFL